VSEQEHWEVTRPFLRWMVVRVTELGVVAGVPTRPFRTVERAFWRHSAALKYAAARPTTGHVRVSNGQLEWTPFR